MTLFAPTDFVPPTMTVPLPAFRRAAASATRTPLPACGGAPPGAIRTANEAGAETELAPFPILTYPFWLKSFRMAVLSADERPLPPAVSRLAASTRAAACWPATGLDDWAGSVTPALVERFCA